MRPSCRVGRAALRQLSFVRQDAPGAFLAPSRAPAHPSRSRTGRGLLRRATLHAIGGGNDRRGPSRITGARGETRICPNGTSPTARARMVPIGRPNQRLLLSARPSSRKRSWVSSSAPHQKRDPLGRTRRHRQMRACSDTRILCTQRREAWQVFERWQHGPAHGIRRE
jgi:hypothetical protein